MGVEAERESVQQPTAQNGDDGDTRREAMLRMAKYTAPAMLAMLLSERAVALTAT